MKNIKSFIPVLLIVLVALGCGMLGNLGIVVKVDEIDATLKPETAVTDVQNGTFAVANYEFAISESNFNASEDLKKPSSDDEILIAFKVDRGARGFDAERGKFKPENIKWFHVYYFKNGTFEQKALKNMKGSVVLPNFKTTEIDIPGAIDITDGDTKIKGAFIAKTLAK
jgi:hypothetical protein